MIWAMWWHMARPCKWSWAIWQEISAHNHLCRHQLPGSQPLAGYVTTQCVWDISRLANNYLICKVHFGFGFDFLSFPYSFSLELDVWETEWQAGNLKQNKRITEVRERTDKGLVTVPLLWFYSGVACLYLSTPAVWRPSLPIPSPSTSYNLTVRRDTLSAILSKHS